MWDESRRSSFGTLIAQYAGFLMGIALWMHNYGRLEKIVGKLKIIN